MENPMKQWIKQALPVAALVLLTMAFGTTTTSAATELETMSSSAQNVTVKITPRNITSNANTWSFTIVLDTHSADLGDDLLKTAVLLDSAGGRFLPVAWNGAPPGGHHRSGTLQFKALSPMPAAIEVQIQREGEVTPRTFRWQLK